MTAFVTGGIRSEAAYSIVVDFVATEYFIVPKPIHDQRPNLEEAQHRKVSAHAVAGFCSRAVTRSSKDTGTIRQTCTARTTAVANNRAPTATCTTVETTIGNSGCAASCPHITRVMDAKKPRHSCAPIKPSMATAGRRTSAICGYTEIARIAVHE